VPALHVRNVPEPLYEKLRARAEREGRSINGEAIAILEEALARPSPTEVRALMTRMFRRRRPGGFFTRFTERGRRVVVRAQEEARALHHAEVGTEHILLGLFDEEQGLAAQILAALEITKEDVRARVEPAGEAEPLRGRLPFAADAKRALELSLREALALGHNHIGTEHILLGVLRDEDSAGSRILRELGADAERTRAAVAAAIGTAALPSWIETAPAEHAGAWAYRVENLTEPLEESLQWLAMTTPGWELVSVTGQAPALKAILKRRAA
jgi:plasmid stability protein